MADPNRRWCRTCLQWKAELEQWLPHGTAHTIKWSRLHSWAWANDSGAIAEVFILPDWDTNNINLKDLSVSLTIWHRCCRFSRQLVTLSDHLKNDRNLLAHNHTSNITTKTKTAMFQNIRNIVNHHEVQQSIHDLPNLLQVLHELEQGDLFRYEHDIINALQVISEQNKNINKKIDRLALELNEQRNELRILTTQVHKINEKITHVMVNLNVTAVMFFVFANVFLLLCMSDFIIPQQSCSQMYSNQDQDISLTSKAEDYNITEIILGWKLQFEEWSSKYKKWKIENDYKNFKRKLLGINNTVVAVGHINGSVTDSVSVTV